MPSAVSAVRSEDAVFGKRHCFRKEVMDSLEKKGSPVVFKKQTVSGKEYGQMDLTGKYRTQDSEEEAACEFLDAHKGCTLNNEEKPFDCEVMAAPDYEGK